MKHKFKYFLTILMPWAIMFNIEEYIVGILSFFLQITVVGWPIASIWACKTLSKHYQKQRHEQHQEYKHQQEEEEKIDDSPKN